MEIISKMALISINETLIVQLISFLIFLFIINRLMIRPLRNVMADRQNYIEIVNNDIQDAREKIAAINGEIQQQETEAKSEAFQIRAELEKSGDQAAKKIIAVAREEIDATNARIKADIDKRMAEAKQSLRAESEALALKMIEKILDRRVAP
jgi:F-type H+-transporting ATPase subunit b